MMELTEKEVDEIDEFMDQHMYGHSIGNSPNIEHEQKFVSIRRCDYKCRKQALKTAIEQALSKREVSVDEPPMEPIAPFETSASWGDPAPPVEQRRHRRKGESHWIGDGCDPPHQRGMRDVVDVSLTPPSA